MLTQLMNGLTALDNGQAVAYLVAGSLIGMFLGVIPGLGGSVILSIVLAFIYHISITGVLCLFLATNAGSYLSSSFAAILLNMPSHPESFAVTLDGYPMSRRGEPGRAIGISASATCVGGLIGCIALVGFIQIINPLGTIFHPPEYVGLIVLTMLLIASLGTDLISKALISVGLGLMLASVGQSLNGVERYTFGTLGLLSGLSLVAVVLGTVALPQMVMLYGTGTATAHQDMLGRTIAPDEGGITLGKGMARQVVQGLTDPFRHPFILIRSAVVGVCTGLIPGIGAFTANFMSYSIAEQSSRKRRHLYGTGIPEGVIAAEGSSLSKEAGHMVPLIGLGIPGGVGGALFLAALTIKDIAPGYGFVTRYPTLTYEMVWIILIGGLIGQFAAVLAAPLLARVTVVPGPALFPFVVALSVVGTFVSTTSYFAVVEMLLFCFVGFVLRRLRYSLASFVIGLVLGTILETNIYQTHALYPGASFLLQRPLADAFVVIAVAFTLLKARQARKGARSAATTAAVGQHPSPEPVAVGVGGAEALDRIAARQAAGTEFPLLGMLTSVGLFVAGASWLGYGVATYDFNAGLLPCIGAGLVTICSLWRVVRDVPAYVVSRRTTSDVAAVPAIAMADRAAAGELAVVGSGRMLVEENVSIDGELPDSPQSGAGDDVPAGEPLDVGATRSTWRRRQSRLDSPLVTHAWGRDGEYTREMAALFWIGEATVLCYVLGFAAGVLLFCLSYCLFATRRIFPRLTRRLIFTALCSAAMWGVTYWILGTIHIYFLPLINL